VRVRIAHRDYTLANSRPEEWLLIEWPEGEDDPTKYWLSTLPEDITLRKLVDLTKLRWRIERDYQELKQEVGLGHFEGRGWRGFHHHATLCVAAYGFLVSERETIPPSGPRSATLFKELAVPDGYRPRGSAATNRTPRPELDRYDAQKINRRACHHSVTMPVLRRSNRQTVAAEKVVTQ
jgi:DDE family transposase